MASVRRALSRSGSGLAAVAILTLICVGQPARAQLLRGGLTPALPSIAAPGGGALSQTLGGVINGASGRVDETAARALERARIDRLTDLVRAHPAELELAPGGVVVVRGAVLALSPSDDLLARATAAGFRSEPLTVEGLDLAAVRFTAPPGLSAREALSQLRRLDPKGRFDLDPLYAPSGGPSQPASGPAAASIHATDAGGASPIGMIDTGIDPKLASLQGVRVVQKGFAAGGIMPAAHGDAVASLISGRQAGLKPAFPGAPLAAADIYGGSVSGGSGDLLFKALAWTSGQGARVINVSLVGPPNLLLEAAVRSLAARGVLIVAPVGNDGPAAPAAYPASYPGVIAVTGVDRQNRILIEAGHAAHVDFAAPGADVMAAAPGGGLASLRGTSFAAPIVTGALARAELQGAAPGAAVAAVARTARKGSGYGRGLVTAP